jgi:hypothetical protein
MAVDATVNVDVAPPTADWGERTGGPLFDDRNRACTTWSPKPAW